MDAPWARVEGHLATMEQEVVDVALHLAQIHQDRGEHRRAAWAARQGLRASPWDERLYRAWMLAASSAGNQTGVQAAWDQLIATLEADCDPTLAVEPETAETYRALRGPGRRHG
jgi:DNA-binding SARP family transcriptional activator